MFKQIAKSVEDRVRSSGKLSIELVFRGIGYDNCNITYNKVICGTEVILRRLFTCCIYYANLDMMLWDIKIFESNTLYLDEAEQYLFLQMLIEASEKWAIEKKLRTVSLSSNLPHISEMFINNRFHETKTKEFTKGVKTYSGMKIIE